MIKFYSFIWEMQQKKTVCFNYFWADIYLY